MPNYHFACDSCEEEIDKNLSIIEFFNIREKGMPCEKCDKGILSIQVSKVRGTVEQSKAQFEMTMKDEIHKTVKEIKAGNQRTIDNIYGDTVNKYKK